MSDENEDGKENRFLRLALTLTLCPEEMGQPRRRSSVVGDRWHYLRAHGQGHCGRLRYVEHCAMKASVLVKVCALLPVLASGFVEPQASGQTWVPIGPPPWMNTNALSMRFFQTAGGITYFTHTSKLPVCYRVTAGSVTRTGTKLAQIINLAHCTGACIECVCYNIETHVSVLDCDCDLQWRPIRLE